MYGAMMLTPEQALVVQALLAEAALAEAQAQMQMQQAQMMPQAFGALSPFAASPAAPGPTQPAPGAAQAPIGLGALLRQLNPPPLINCWGGVSKAQFDMINARRTGAPLLPFGVDPAMMDATQAQYMAPFAAEQELAPMFIPPTAQQMLAMQQWLAAMLPKPPPGQLGGFTPPLANW